MRVPKMTSHKDLCATSGTGRSIFFIFSLVSTSSITRRTQWTYPCTSRSSLRKSVQVNKSVKSTLSGMPSRSQTTTKASSASSGMKDRISSFRNELAFAAGSFVIICGFFLSQWCQQDLSVHLCNSFS